MEFTNNDAKVDVVLSDIYVGGKLLARVQAERRYMVIQKLKQTHANKEEIENEEGNVEVDNADTSDRRELLQSKTKSRYKQMLASMRVKNGHDYVVSEKILLSSRNEEDINIIKSKCDQLSVLYFHDAAISNV